jgi:hypothetical protein
MDWNTFLLIQKPFYQALLCVLLTPVFILIIKPKSADRAWTIAAYIFGLFLIFNVAMLWFDSDPWRYFFYSIGFSLGYALSVSIIMPVLLKFLQLERSQESAMAFLIMIYQPFALLLMLFVKWIVNK